MDVNQVRETVFGILGHNGAMISASKSGYVGRYPNNIVVFNSNVCTKGHSKIWYGDLDITKDEAKLKKLAAAIGEDVYVLREMDGRFGDNELNPKLDRARAVITPAGELTIHEVRY